MIKKRNLDNSLIQWIMTVTGLGPGIGEVHYVALAASATSQYRTNLNAMGVGVDQPIHSTIQAAVTKKVDYRNDVILVLPGTYIETVTDPLFSGSQLLGCGAMPDAVTVQSAAGHALAIGTDAATTASMVNSGIRNMTFLTPSGGTYAKAALLVTVMQKSIIDYCKFKGTYNAGGTISTVGFQFGSHTDTEMEFPEHNILSRCEFTSNGPRNQELDTAIRVGAPTCTNLDYRGFKSIQIIDNLIGAEHYGINMWTGASSCNGSLIARNIITAHQGGDGPNMGIISRASVTDALCMIIDNRITAQSDCIRNFSTGNCQGNIVSLSNATPDYEYEDGT